MLSEKTNRGFALPTILIASVVMIIVLLSAVSAAISTQSAMDSQYYTQLAREAAESGATYALACIKSNNNTAPWMANGAQLKPNLACDGITQTGGSAYVEQTSTLQTTFTVSAVQSDPTSIKISVVSEVDLLRGSNSSSIWRSYNAATNAQAGTSLSFSTVAFGYSAGYGNGILGAFFATIASDGTLKAAGLNADGQLGNGTTSNTVVPTVFQLPNGNIPASIATNFLSNGVNMYVITNNGTVYGAGSNWAGQLGNSSTSASSTPVQFALPAGKTAQYVSTLGNTTWVTTADGYVYAAGACNNGILGNGNTISGCSNYSSYTRVLLPTPTTSNLNTIPTSNLTADGWIAFLRMSGGAVYGWGWNNFGQFGNGTTTASSTPTQLGTWGNTGQPKATQVFTDGDTLYVVDDSGGLKESGSNAYGELAGDKIPIYNANVSKCIDDVNGSGTSVQLYSCLGNANQQWQFRSDGSIYAPAVNKCLDNNNGDGTNLQLYTCNQTGPQTWQLRDDNSIYNPQSGHCLDNKTGDGVTLWLYPCNQTGPQVWSLPAVSNFVNFALPAGAGTAVKVWTDQWFVTVLTSNGQVWSAGLNNVGQLGNGKTSKYQPYPVQFILPNGVTAKDIYNTSYGPLGAPGIYSLDTLVIGSDGKVYGAGANNYGQLGDGTTTNRSTPVAMQSIDGVVEKAQQVQIGYGTSVIFTTDQKVFTVGNNSNGQLGDGTTTNSSIPKANRYTNLLPTAVF